MLRKPLIKKIFSAFPYPIFRFSRHHHEKPCGSCGGQNLVMRFLCGDCHVLQNPDLTITNLNYFEIFNLKPSFQIDKKKLDRDFKKMQMFFHPDKFAISHDKNSSYAQKYSQILNEAYRTLKNDVNRALYILELNGHKMEEHNRMEDIDFMEQILEKRSQIESSNDPKEIEKIKEENDMIIKDMLTEISEKIGKGKYEEALSLIERLKYFDRIDQAVQAWEARPE